MRDLVKIYVDESDHSQVIHRPLVNDESNIYTHKSMINKDPIIISHLQVYGKS